MRRRLDDVEDGSRGNAVLLTLVFTSLLTALGVGLITLTNTERAIAGNYQAGVQTLYAADALAEHALFDLGSQESWTDTLLGNRASSFVDTSTRPTTAWRETLDLVVLTTDLQRQTDAASVWGFDTPAWRLFSWGSFDALVGAGSFEPAAYLVAWVADDVSDGDSNPLLDSNGILTVRVEALGPRGLCRIVQIAVEREGTHASVSGTGTRSARGIGAAGRDALARILPDPAGEPVAGVPAIRVLSWREVR